MLAVHTPREWKTWVINLPQPMRVEIYLSSPKSPKSKKSSSRHLGNSPSCLLMEGWNERQNHLGWKIPSRSSCPTISLTYWDPPLNHIPQCHIHTSFQYLQEWGVCSLLRCLANLCLKTETQKIQVYSLTMHPPGQRALVLGPIPGKFLCTFHLMNWMKHKAMQGAASTTSQFQGGSYCPVLQPQHTSICQHTLKITNK